MSILWRSEIYRYGRIAQCKKLAFLRKVCHAKRRSVGDLRRRLGVGDDFDSRARNIKLPTTRASRPRLWEINHFSHPTSINATYEQTRLGCDGSAAVQNTAKPVHEPLRLEHFLQRQEDTLCP